MPMSTYNPKTKRYERDAQKDYSKPQTKVAPDSQELKALKAANIILVAKLEAIAKCTNVKAVRAILS